MLFILVLLTGCSPIQKEQNGLWITYYELEKIFESGLEQEFKKVIENCKEMQIENLYIHTRAFGSTIYDSDYFPKLEKAEKYDFDIFEFMINECKKADIKVHAWINPYRISSNGDISKLNTKSPAYRWLNDETSENDNNVCFSNGIYLNPASSQVKTLIVDSIRELIAKYQIDGIHFDDYFYPTTNTEFDKVSYLNYRKQNTNPKSLSNWRRNNVDELIKECRNAIKYADEKIIFSISPAASIKQNYNNLYADVEFWIKENYIDEIIPQLYFGFEYPDESFRFLNLLEEWKGLVLENKNVKLKIGLGIYKAKPQFKEDKTEWTTNHDIISRQAEICKIDPEISGYILFSYSSLFSNEEEFTKERENLKNIIIGER